jgi:hypothetical protein
LEAGNKAPTWEHNRKWQFIVLRTEEEKEYAFSEAKAIADKFDADRYLNMPRPYSILLRYSPFGEKYLLHRLFLHQRKKGKAEKRFRNRNGGLCANRFLLLIYL